MFTEGVELRGKGGKGQSGATGSPSAVTHRTRGKDEKSVCQSKKGKNIIPAPHISTMNVLKGSSDWGEEGVRE